MTLVIEAQFTVFSECVMELCSVQSLQASQSEPGQARVCTATDRRQTTKLIDVTEGYVSMVEF